MTEMTGSCLCGAVRLVISGSPLRAGLCHCMTCRKESGSAFKPFVVFPAEAVTIHGRTESWRPGGEGAPRHFCPTCGSPVFEHEPGDPEIEFGLGILDEPDQVVPTYELWTVRKEAWLPVLFAERHDRDREP